jgi:MATE family multidrug resistance protein
MRPTLHGDGGVKQLAVVGFPLLLSSLCGVLNLFFDRLFLSWYDDDPTLPHMNASLTASLTWWWLLQIAMGIVTYVSTFVAQYTGAGRPRSVGAIVWQGVYVALAFGMAALALVWVWRPLFQWMHADNPLLIGLEVTYATVVTFGSPFLLLNAALGAFFLGLGRTRFVLLATTAVTLANILLNRWLIFSPPQWAPFITPGVSGAAWGTTISFALGTCIYTARISLSRSCRGFGLLQGRSFKPTLTWRLFRYGSPQGLQMFVDMASFTVFVLLLAHVDFAAFTASNVALTLNLLMFGPMIGFSQGIGILVGRFIGAGKPYLAEKTTSAGLILALCYSGILSVAFIVIPDTLSAIFLSGQDHGPEYQRIVEMARIYLFMAAIFQIGDAFSLATTGALRGAGDTTYIMWVSLLVPTTLLVLPCLLILWLGGGATLMWVFVVLTITGYAVSFTFRYRAGHWRHLRVIEPDLVKSEV